MRISDWSSDVCSSDLVKRTRTSGILLILAAASLLLAACDDGANQPSAAPTPPPPPEVTAMTVAPRTVALERTYPARAQAADDVEVRDQVEGILRSEERRVGKEGGRTGSYRWSPDQ